MENQETTRKKNRFDMKRFFRRISAVIATMAFTTGLAACGSSQSTAPSANKATSSVTALPPSLPPRAGRSSRPRIWAIPSISRAFRRRTPIRIPPALMPAIRRSMTRITSTTLCPSPNSLGSKSRTPRGSMTRRNVRS